MSLTAELNARVDAAYQQSGNTLGWRLLYSPVAVLAGARVAFIGLNPGGRVAPPEHSQLAMQTGSAYVEEVWGEGRPAGCSPLQQQVRALFALLHVQPEEVLAGNLVPFRSPDWASLRNPETVLKFSRQLWRDIFGSVRPSLVIAMGKVPTIEMAKILNVSDSEVLPVGWKRSGATRATGNGVTLIGLPHLSRFRIIGRPASEPFVAALFQGFLPERAETGG